MVRKKKEIKEKGMFKCRFILVCFRYAWLLYLSLLSCELRYFRDSECRGNISVCGDLLKY